MNGWEGSKMDRWDANRLYLKIKKFGQKTDVGKGGLSGNEFGGMGISGKHYR